MCVLVVVLAVLCVVSASMDRGHSSTSHDMLVWSRYGSGKSSRIKLRDASGMRDVGVSPAASTTTSASVDSESDTEAFWDRHAAHVWGVNARDMVHSRTAAVSASGVVYEHHSQVVQGRRVFGGEVVLAKDGESDVVLRARGHPMPTKAMMEDGFNDNGATMVAEVVVTAEEAVDRVQVALLMRAGAVTGTDTAVEEQAQKQVHLEVSASEVMWYRLGLARGSPSGDVVLAYVIDAQATVAGAEAGRGTWVGRAVVDASSGRVLSLANQAGLRGKGRKGDADGRGKGALSSGRKQHTKAPSTAQRLKGTTASGRASSRRLDANPGDFKIRTYDCSGGFCDNSPYYNSANGGLNNQDATTQLVVRTTAQMGNLYSSISGGGVKSFKGGSSNVVWNAHLYLDEDNAYYYDDAIYFGDGFVTDDVIAHEWVHGYTAYSSGYNYEFQSGAINEAMSDIFGEALDILNEEFDAEDDMGARSGNQQCTQEYAYGSRAGSDGSRKWIIGEDCDLGGGDDGLRDMYFPECYLDPSDTQSNSYYCADSASDHYYERDDAGGVHYNSGVVNRLFAVTVDGGTIELLSTTTTTTVTVAGLGFEKALGLVAESQEDGLPTDQFEDWAQDMLDICDTKAAASGDARKYYVPDLENGNSVRGAVVTTADCDMLSKIVDASGMLHDPSDYCPYSNTDNGISSNDADIMCGLLSDDDLSLANEVNSNALNGWACSGGSPVRDPCSYAGAWTGVFCKGDSGDDEGEITMVSLPYYYLGYTGSSASLPASLADLPELRYIDLRYNRLTGTIPDEIADIPKLKGLDLSNNNLQGPIPFGFCDLLGDQLDHLDLTSNNFECYPSCFDSFSTGVYVDAGMSVCSSVVWSWDTTITLAGISAAEFNSDSANALAFREAVHASMGSGYALQDVGSDLVVADSRRRRRLSAGDGDGDGGDDNGGRLLQGSQVDVTYGTSVAVDDDPDGDVVDAVQTQMTNALSNGNFDASLSAEATNNGASAALGSATSEGIPAFGPATSEAQDYDVADDDEEGGLTVSIEGLAVVLFLAGAMVTGIVFCARMCNREGEQRQQQTAAAARGRAGPGWNGGGGGGGVVREPHTHVQMAAVPAQASAWRGRSTPMAQAEVVQAPSVTY